MYDYEHTQPGTLLRVCLGALCLLMGTWGLLLTAAGTEAGIFLLIIPMITGVVLSLFHALTVRVSANTVELSFGVGVISKTFALSDLVSARAVKNSWIYGWGIKKIWGGWLFNVSGFDAVEVMHRNGKKYRIGTDEPARLLAAIEAKLR